MSKKVFSVFLLMMIALTFGLSINANNIVKPKREWKFKIRIENISTGDQINPSGSRYPFAVSPGMYVVRSKDMPLFRIGKKAAIGIEMQAEDGNPALLRDSLIGSAGNSRFGIFNTPVAADKPAPILPGGTYEFEVKATDGQKLLVTAMFGQSNDLFYAPSKAISFFEKGKPFNGDITDRFMLWDAGTEVNEEPGTGQNQAPRQKAPNSGIAEAGVVKLVSDGFVYPETKAVLRITVTPLN